MIELSDLHLGKQSKYQSRYNPGLLTPVPRAYNRDKLTVTELPFHGVDFWNCYEISWINAKGKPLVALGLLQVPADSPNIVESKSLKLYLNSFNQEPLTWQQVESLIAKDLTECVGTQVDFTLYSLDDSEQFNVTENLGKCLDNLDVTCDTFSVSESILKCKERSQTVSEILYSNLLKSNCLITGQPDWATVEISYTGKPIDHEALLRYIVSYRQHNEFHEHCVERMFVDIWQQCQPDKLSVYARYTRRGGVDINPFRSSDRTIPHFKRLVRQ